jgi:hypothetical protein
MRRNDIAGNRIVYRLPCRESVMVAAIPHEQSLGEALVERAQRASMRRLILDIAGGLLALGILAACKPKGWAVLASAALCFATFGAWGATDRLLASPDRVGNNAVAASLLILRTIAIVVGVAASLVVVFGALQIAMGTFIH